MRKPFTETYRGTQVRKLAEGEDRVDREAGVIRGVKLLGFESKNDEGKRRYRAPAAELYEDVPVNINHPEFFSDVDAMSRFGVVLSGTVTVVEGDGVYGDIEYNPKSASTEAILWWAENHPNQLGMSHMAFGTQEEIDGLIWITVEEVESVDLVARPATTGGFFEKHDRTPKETPKMDPKELYEAEVAAHAQTKAELAEARQAKVVAEQALTTEQAAHTKTKTEHAREALIADANLGEVDANFVEAVKAAADDDAAKALIESVRKLIEKTAAPASSDPKSISKESLRGKDGGDSDSNSESPKTYADLKESGALDYKNQV